MAIDHRIGSKVIKNARREEASGTRVEPYPYVGVVKNNIDPTRGGRLQIYIPDLGGDPDDESNWRTVSYASPYQGYTEQVQKATDRPSTENKFNTVSHTYGMWMVPPDIGVQVIVMFIAGDPLRGYWLACVNPHLSHYMVPALAGTQNVDLTSLTPGQRKTVKDGDILPVVEFNEYTKDFTKTSFYLNNKPVHQTQWQIYKDQGLDKDFVRGPISSSSQRESPSHVFGISTPGRDIDDPADDANYIANLNAGKLDNKYKTTKTRKGGHVFVMDDGATMGEDQLIRLRTAGGHQILMHDTNETIYIAHNKGNSWIELGKDGSIQMYSSGGIAVRTEGALNINAGGDFNLDVGGKINIKSGSGFKLETPMVDFLTDGKFNVTAKGGTELKTGGFKVDTTGKISLKADGKIAMQGAGLLQQSGGVDSLKDVKPIPTNNLTDTTGTIGAWSVKPGSLKTIVTVAPAHEPYIRGTTATIFSFQAKGIQPGAYTGAADATKNTTVAPLANPATLKDLRNAPEAKEAVGTLSKDQTTALLAQVSKGTDYSTTGADGAIGKYQSDFKTLQASGYVKSTVTSNADLQNPNSWTGKNGISDVGGWQASTGEQESLMAVTTKQNYTTMLASGAITSEQSPEDVAGMMAVAHKLGPDAAKAFREGSGPGSDIFNQGKFAISVLAPQLSTVAAG